MNAARDEAAITVVVPNWNGAHLLPGCLGALRRQRQHDFRVVVVDDASTDGSIALLARDYPDVEVIRQPKRWGFCAAVNAGIRAGTSPYVALLNNDAMPDPRWLDASLRALGQSPRAAGCAPKILFYDRPHVINSMGIYLRPDGASRDIGFGEVDSELFNNGGEVFGISGCASVLRRSALDDIGLFDESLVAYAEDLDWSLRARLRGYSFVYEPEAVVFHRLSSTYACLPSDSTYYRSRNSAYVLLKNLPVSLLVAGAPRLFLFQVYQVATAARQGQLRAAVSGKISVLASWGRIAAARRADKPRQRLSPSQLARLMESSRSVLTASL